MVESIPLPQLRDVIVHAGRMLGLSELDDNDEPTNVTVGDAPRDAAAPTPVIGPRVGPKPTPAIVTGPPPANGKLRAPNDRGATPPPKLVPPIPSAKGGRGAASPFEPEAPPQPDDDLALLEELSGRVI